jgi:hypothetical protein
MQLVNGLIQTTSVSSQLVGDTTVNPSSPLGFPAIPQFTVLNVRTGELLLVTALGPPWTVTRGFGSSTAAAINAGDPLQYSVTREMLLAGFMAKLDEVVLAADSSAVLTLTVPSGLPFLRNLKLHVNGNAVSDCDLDWRFNSDSSNTYIQNYAYWGSGSSSGQQTSTYGRIWIGGQTFPQVGVDAEITIGGADAADRWKTWQVIQWLRQSGGQYYVMVESGSWQPTTQAAISTVQLAAGNTWNAVTLRAGFRAQLYGVP